MGVSSNSIIHFTDSLDAIKGIIKNSFKLKYCREYIYIGDDSYVDILVPMVSFCDIPLSEIKEHIDKYGSYGVGLTKEWARKNHLNPVLYIDKNSFLNKTLGSAVESYIISKHQGKNPLHALPIEDRPVIDILRYVKNYQEDLKRKEETIPDYRFYDEREWRYVPDVNEDIGFCFDRDKLEGFEDVYADSQEKLSDLKLSFSPEDISYIIINDDSEIHEILRFLKETMGGEFSYKSIERLSTRILTVAQIKGDF
ncbi:abortive infection system antitoxin AbiGi family protein [Vibrio owensii]|uniref:Uncharacterized protein n=1 Tax=Vibrio owensii CAIM 1854 = LMG 25443 TaxID=1229493 RepID=A0A0C1ZDQ1_9VIBR|nr:abortive infection system antitoxin AbiGi family protein [Vibrio owensii]KIF54174.1 hypothetical protein H735_03745 [Vibrio owensii CAIM 1854 = LMG 25443]